MCFERYGKFKIKSIEADFTLRINCASNCYKIAIFQHFHWWLMSFTIDHAYVLIAQTYNLLLIGQEIV